MGQICSVHLLKIKVPVLHDVALPVQGMTMSTFIIIIIMFLKV